MARFTDIFSDETKRGYKIQTSEYLPAGKYPIIDQGQTQIVGYTNLENGLFTDVPAIIFGDHTRIIKYIDTPFFLGADGVKVLKVKVTNADYKYLFYCLQNIRIPNTGYNRHFKWLKEVNIPFPNLNEQRKIAAVLDKVSDLIAKRRQQLDKLDELVKSRFVEMFGDPVENLMEWEKIALGKRCDIVTGNTPSRAEPENYGNFIEWIKSDNINTPAVLLTEAQEYLSEKGFYKCRFVEGGSLLMTCIAGSINCIGNVAVTDRRVAFNQQINAIIPKQDDVLYLYWLMKLSKPIIHGTINMALKGILSKGQLLEMVFPFPPLELQNQFSVFANRTENAKTSTTHSLEKLYILKKSLMQHYFA